MKKFLSAAVAFGMVAGVAATASALELKVQGAYEAAGYWIDAYNDGADPVEGGNDGDWYQHRFRLQPDLIVNDKIQVKSDIRLISSNTVWGSQDDLKTSNGENFNVDKLWMIYDSPVGKWEIGRRPGGSWGLDFVSSGSNADRIMWHFPTSGPLKGYAFLQKNEERDISGAFESDGPLVSGFNGEDSDYYETAMGYKTDAMTAYLGVGTTQDDSADNNFWRVKGYGEFGAGPVNIFSEFDYKFGDKADIDYDSYALILGAKGNAGNISWMGAYFTMSGDSNSADNKNTAYDANHGTGDDFEPLYIMTGNRVNVLNGDLFGNQPNAARKAGVHGVVGSSDFKVSEDLTLHGALGWAMAEDAPAGFDDEYGWEANLGLAYKLYQNLTYELHFGYWFVGDFFEEAGAVSTDDVMLLSHHLTMKF